MSPYQSPARNAPSNPGPAVWVLALAGIVLQIVWSHHLLKLRIGLYLALGWLIISWARPVFDGLGFSGTGFLVSGGLAYSSGVIFYLWQRLPFNQAVWHLFVITGTILMSARPRAGTNETVAAPGGNPTLIGLLLARIGPGRAPTR